LYNGLEGTQFWVVPKNNSDTYDIRTDVTPYLENYISVQMITKDFDVGEYIANRDDARYQYRQFEYGEKLTRTDFNYDTYTNDPEVWLHDEMLNF
jgi:hypothetical protein